MKGLHETAIIVPHQSQETGQSDFNDTYPQGDGQTHCQRQNCLRFGVNGLSRLFLFNV
jgi:hypothetical protein